MSEKEAPIQINFVEGQLVKMSLEKGDVLGVKIYSDQDIGHDSLKYLQNQLEELFPHNRVMLFCLRKGDEINFTAIKSPEAEADTTSQACTDCSCGKADRLKALDELTEEAEKLDLYKGDLP